MKNLNIVKILPDDEVNKDKVKRIITHKGKVIWLLTDKGNEWIFSDQKEIERHNCIFWETHNVPFKNYPHYIYQYESGRCVGYAWYSEIENYVEDFKDMESCLDWLVDYEGE